MFIRTHACGRQPAAGPVDPANPAWRDRSRTWRPPRHYTLYGIPMSSTALDMASRFVNRSPFNRWLGMSVLEAGEQGIVLGIKWREELISSPEIRSTHGGILATLIDAAGDYAVALKTGHPVPTMDMHVDYHRVATPGDLRAEGQVIHFGKRFATAHARVLDMDGNLVASGRALYLIRAPQPGAAQGEA